MSEVVGKRRESGVARRVCVWIYQRHISISKNSMQGMKEEEKRESVQD